MLKSPRLKPIQASAGRQSATRPAFYVLPNLPIGPYRLEATLPGFRTFAQTGIVLQVNSNPAINIVLQVGQLTETVEVQANAAMVETRSTGVGQVMENARILELPLVGRQVYDLVTLSGAAVQTGIAQTTNRAAYPGTRHSQSRDVLTRETR